MDHLLLMLDLIFPYETIFGQCIPNQNVTLKSFCQSDSESFYTVETLHLDPLNQSVQVIKPFDFDQKHTKN